MSALQHKKPKLVIHALFVLKIDFVVTICRRLCFCGVATLAKQRTERLVVGVRDVSVSIFNSEPFSDVLDEALIHRKKRDIRNHLNAK